MEKCELCGKLLNKKQFGVHLKAHNISAEEYYLTYIGAENESQCSVCGKKKRFIGVFVGYTKYCSLKCSNNSESVKRLKNDTWIKNYGEVNPFRFGSKRHRESIKKLYGVDNVFQSEEIKEKIRQTNLTKYGVENPSHLEKTKINGHTKEVNRKRLATKRSNGTVNTSKAEEDFNRFLLTIFKSEDIKREYNEDERYPFHCDFYIQSLDLFIELNLHPTHNHHNFNRNNPNDIRQLNEFKSKRSKFYDKVIEVWTVADVNKYNTALQNNLNYKQIWDIKELEEYKQELIERYGK